MLRNILIATVLPVMLTSAALPVRAEEPMYFLVTGERLFCLRQHAGDYAPEAADDTVFIAVADCGKANAASVSLLDQVINSAPDISVSQEDQPDKVIALTGADINCLASLDVPVEAGLLAFFPEKCDVEIRN